MAKENSETHGGDKPMSMKERLLAQRRAAAEEPPARSAPPVPASRPAAAKPAAPPRAAARTAEPEPEAAPKRPARSSRQLAAEAAEERRTSRRTVSADVQREIEMLRKQQDKWIVYGWIVAGVLVLGAGGFWFYVQHKKRTEIEARERYEQTVKSVVEEILAIPPTSVENANKIIARAEETKMSLPGGDGWKLTYVEGATGKVAGHLSKATNFLEDNKRRTELVDGLNAVEAAARDAATKTPEELASLRRRLVEYENNASRVGAEFEARVAKVKIDINRAYVRRLYEAAKDTAAKGETRAALQAFTLAEDSIRDLLDEAYQRRNQDAIDWAQPLFEQCIADSDKLVYQVFTPDAIAKAPWRDLLNTPGTEWLNDGLKGFRTEGGVMQAVGSDPGSKREGIFSVGDREKWRDFVMEVEFVPVKGDTTLYWRLGKQTQTAPDEVLISVSNGDFKAGQTYSITASYIGSRRLFEWSPNAERDPESLDPINWRRNRAGAFGGVLKEGAEFKITKLRIKVLR